MEYATRGRTVGLWLGMEMYWEKDSRKDTCTISWSVCYFIFLVAAESLGPI